MAYDQAFFDAYKHYLLEPRVRANHDKVFAMFDALCGGGAGPKVVDLGCGTGEFKRYGNFDFYMGIDLEPRVSGPAFRKGNYLEEGIPKENLPFVPNAFVSLFSIEPCLPAKDRYALYAKLFRENPSLRYGLSAGFYYDTVDQCRKETVAETGGIVSYQTIEPLRAFPLEGVTEHRVHMHTPSEMFGPDVLEVYKFFVRE